MEIDLSAFDDIQIEGVQEASSKNRVDIVFVIDNSGSMAPVIEGVKNNVKTFVTSLQDNANNEVDYRLGFVIHDMLTFYVKPFTADANAFVSAVDQTKADNYNEMTLAGIDRALDFSWDEKRHKFILHFTDECVSSGYAVEEQMSKHELLISKLEQKRVKFYHFGIDCPEYEAFKRAPGTHYSVQNDFSRVDFSKLLDTIGRSVSQASGAALQGGSQTNSDPLFDLSIHGTNEVVL